MENIIVFGIGKYFNYKKDSLKKIYNVTAFLDNSIIDKKWNDEFKCYIYNPKAIW